MDIRVNIAYKCHIFTPENALERLGPRTTVGFFFFLTDLHLYNNIIIIIQVDQQD